MSQICSLTQLQEAGDGRVVSIADVLPHLSIELDGPIERLIVVRARSITEIMDDVSGAEDQHALGSQKPQLLPQFVMKCGRLAEVDAELNDRNVGRGEHIFKDDPRAMVEAPLSVAANGNLRFESRSEERRVGKGCNYP